MRMLAIQVNIREQTLKLYQPFMLDNRFIFEAEKLVCERVYFDSATILRQLTS